MKAKKMKPLLLFGMAGVVVASATACSGNSEQAAKGQDDKPKSTAASGVDTSPLGKYKTPITVTIARDQEANTTFAEGETMDNNIFTRGYKDELGIEIKNVWVTDPTQYWEKLNIAITSGDLPDIFKVKPAQLKELADEGLIADLTDTYKKYISPLSEQKLKSDGGAGLKMATIDGKLYGLPSTSAAYDGATMLWIRKDWMDNLGLQAPKTIDDMINIARAFKTKDPDKDGKDDTLGIGVVKNIFGGGGGLLGFFNGFHVYPNLWVKDDATGKLMNGYLQPKTKDALAMLQQMYKEGLIDKEFSTQTGIGPDVISGKMGMFYGTMSNPLNPLQQNKDKDPKAEWQYYPIPSIDGTPAKPQISFNPGFFYVVNKNSKHPEALMKLMNFYEEKGFGEHADFKYMYDDKNNSTFKYAFVRNLGATKNVDNYNAIKIALSSNDTSKLNPEQKGYYDQIKQFESGDKKMWQYAEIFGPQGTQSLVDKYMKNNLLVSNGYVGLPTQTMVDKDGPINDLALETFTKIILGDPVSNYDKFVQDWSKLGGDQIAKDVNDWYAKQK